MADSILRHKIKCHYSGLQIGTMDVLTTAGVLPYISHWDKCIAYHPVFSLSHEKLLRFARSEWDRLAKRTETDQEITDHESNTLCVTYLALLHSLDCIKQDVPALPPITVVQNTIEKLFALAYWKWKLESQRFKFPTLHISKYNTNADFSTMHDYFATCFDVRKAYETNVREAVELEKLKTAEKALLALNNTWVTPASRRTLWAWVRAHLPEKYHPDAEGWLSTLFLGGSNAIVDFDEEDIKLAEEIIVSSCPAGTGVMFAVRKRLDDIKRIWEQHNAAFEIDLEDFAEGSNLYVNGVKVAAPEPGPEPTLADHGYNKSKYFVAKAKWDIAMAAWKKENPQ